MSKRTLATMYGVGLVKFAPGTMGSLVAALLAVPVLMLPYGWLWLALGTVLVTILGTRSATRYMQAHGTDHDPSEIVVDEWAGQWLTYAIFPAYAVWIGDGNVATRLTSGPQIITHLIAGFLLFRLFDILKPWPISLVDRRVKGGFGVMADDLVAAIPAAMLCFPVSIPIIWLMAALRGWE